MIIEYFKKVISKWWILLGLLPEVYDKVALYFHIEYKLPEESTIYLFFALLFVSTYLVWKEEKEKTAALEEKSKNPVDYEITAKIYPFDDDIENSIQNLVKVIDDTQNEIDEINKSLPDNNQSKHKIKATLINNDVDGMTRLYSDMFHISDSFLNNKLVQVQRKKIYKDSLMDYITSMHKYIEEMKDYYENRKGKIFYVVFYIHNTGSIFDESIDINISSKDSIFADKLDFDNTLIKPKKPKESEIINDNLFMNPIFDIPSIKNFDINPHRLRRNVEIKDKNISLVLRDLKVDVEIELLEKIVFIKSDNINDLETEIISKNANKKIQKNVKLEIKDKVTLKDIYNMLHHDDND